MIDKDFNSEKLRKSLMERKKKEEPKADPLFELYSRKDAPGRNIAPTSPDFNAYPGSPSPLRIGNVTSGLNPYTGTWDTRAVLHLLKRTGYGFKKSHADTLQALTMSQAVDLVLTVSSTPPSPPVNYYQYLVADENGLAYGSDFTENAINSYTTGVNTNILRSEGVKYWLTGLALNHDITIREKMTHFWYHFIPVDFNTVLDSNNVYCATNSARICYKYLKLFRDFATGNFKTLISQMAVQPAMMYYLNNQANNNIAPDENFAREIMELFTLGKGPETQYTQSDVVAAAKVLTGWRVLNLNEPNPVTSFVPDLHDYSNKQFSSFFNNTVITGSGSGELQQFIDMIFTKQKIVSEYICRRLYRFFVYYDIDANIEANVIVPLAQTFVNSNWEILPVLKQLFKSEHFYDVANRGVYIKSPYDVIIGTSRTFNFQLTNPDIYQQYFIWSFYNNAVLTTMNQVMGEVPNVSGWPAYYQVPSFHQFWINAITSQQRFALLTYIIWGFDVKPDDETISARLEINEIAFVEQFSNTIIRNPNNLIIECIKYLLPIDLSLTERNKIKLETLLYQQTNDSYWTNSWDLYKLSPTNTTLRDNVRFRLKFLFNAILQLAEFQLT